MSRGRLPIALAASAAVVLASPFVSVMFAAIQRAFPAREGAIVAAVVIAPLMAAIGIALMRIRDRWPLRYAAIAAAVALATAWVAVVEPIPTEQFHLTEYGALTVLFYRAWRRRPDVCALLLPVCAATITGLADEWFQWFVPSRVGELRDVALNLVGVLCGLLVAIGVDPPRGVALPAEPHARRVLAAALVAVIVAGAAFLQSVHLGYEIEDPEAGRFHSRFSPSALVALSSDRADRWALAPPRASMPLISREDHYLTEARFHVQARNDAMAEGDLQTAWQENLILERYYAPALAVESLGFRWAAAQRESMAAQGSGAEGAYVSEAYPYPLYVWSSWMLWATAVALAGVASLVSFVRPARAADVAAV